MYLSKGSCRFVYGFGCLELNQLFAVITLSNHTFQACFFQFFVKTKCSHTKKIRPKKHTEDFICKPHQTGFHSHRKYVSRKSLHQEIISTICCSLVFNWIQHFFHRMACAGLAPMVVEDFHHSEKPSADHWGLSLGSEKFTGTFSFVFCYDHNKTKRNSSESEK